MSDAGPVHPKLLTFVAQQIDLNQKLIARIENLEVITTDLIKALESAHELNRSMLRRLSRLEDAKEVPLP
jgi:hypothetical protein